ncbi:hypothetical protein LT85_0728 [Collimonas arenae]|uniref:Uncharacterized protein n=1 Tax=Collimonas arenae TaxID=279058 RepID=A0A0A1F5A4_9BURK|nr:hypothetical protein [Collimonas arenae]AIY39888.1 hypothetical protein LT85_0728 [Collimonas arenae]
MQYGYLVGLFDILGFEHRLAEMGLPKMVSLYEELMGVVNYRKDQEKRVFGDLGFTESAYWTSEGDVSIFDKVQGAYSSDSILLWSNRTWPEGRNKTADELNVLQKDAAHGWQFHPIPCDNFLDVCNDVICHGLEVGLPLRGALSLGEAFFDESRNIFLGRPIIDAARLEPGQRFIGASLCTPFSGQTIPERFLLRFDKHLKNGYENAFDGYVLDWPRHWRKTRTGDVRNVIESLNKDVRYAVYYETTLELVEHSMKFAGQFESDFETSIRTVYQQFSRANDQLTMRARAVRRIPIEPDKSE